MHLRDVLYPGLLLTALLPATASAQTIDTVAGNGTTLDTGDGGSATTAGIGYPTGVVAAPDGGFYIGGYNIVRHVSADGRIRTVAGNGTSGSSGDGGPATAALVQGNISGLALGADGSLFIGEIFAVRKVSPAGIISTVASHPAGATALALDAAGNLYIGAGCVVTKMAPGGALSRFAGTGQCGPTAGDGGPATDATMTANIYGVAVDVSGNVWLADNWAHRIRRVGLDGVIHTVTSDVWSPMGLSAAANGDVYAADLSGAMVWRLDSTGTASVVAGTPYLSGFGGDGGAATEAKLDMPWGVSVGSGRLLIVDTRNNRIRSVSADVLPVPVRPAITCASEGYTGTKLTWCQNVCEKGYTGATLDMWIHRWVNRYRDLPYCAVEGNVPQLK
jgi:hypothetical protein